MYSSLIGNESPETVEILNKLPLLSLMDLTAIIAEVIFLAAINMNTEPYVVIEEIKTGLSNVKLESLKEIRDEGK